jgi:phospholipase A1
VWALIFKADSSNLHNPDIAKFLGHENLHFSYRLHDVVLSLEAQNLESGLRRGFLQATVSYPLLKHFSIYGQFFTGYGQSLIEYDHRTNGAGIGIAFNDWV